MLLPFYCLPRECSVEGYDTVKDDSDGTMEPDDLIAVTDEMDLNSSSSDSERIMRG